MTTVIAKRIFEGVVLTTSNATLYTSPANTKTIIKAANFLNYGSGAVTITVYLVPSGGSAAAASAAISAYSMAAATSYQAPELSNQVLEAGDFLVARADTGTSISATASGATIS